MTTCDYFEGKAHAVDRCPGCREQRQLVPTVSVIIPTYNAENSIKQTVESVLLQSFADFEIIIVDDGSHDHTLAVVDTIEDPRICIFRYPNAGVRGPAAGRNRGLKHAHGDLVAFLDHDDLWQPEKLAAQVQALNDHPDAAVAYSWVDVIDENGQLVGPLSRTTVNGEAFDALLQGCFPWTGSNPLIRRSALEQIGPFDETVGGADDWDMWLRLAEHHLFVCIPQPHVLWRRTRGGASSDAKHLYSSSLRVLNRTFSRNPNLSSSQQESALICLYEGVIASSASGNPTRANSRVTIGITVAAVRSRPEFFYEISRKPWLLRAIGKALIVLVFPERPGRAVLDWARSLAARWNDISPSI